MKAGIHILDMNMQKQDFHFVPGSNMIVKRLMMTGTYDLQLDVESEP
jgi:hypothetical protein